MFYGTHTAVQNGDGDTAVTRVPQGERTYRGELGGTHQVRRTLGGERSEQVLAYRTINVVETPLLGQALQRSFAVHPVVDSDERVAVPFLYHDPENKLFALVLPSEKTSDVVEFRELSRFFSELAAEREWVPAYVRRPEVIRGWDAFRQWAKPHRRSQSEADFEELFQESREPTDISAPPVPTPARPVKRATVIEFAEMAPGRTVNKLFDDGIVRFCLRLGDEQRTALLDQTSTEVRIQLHRMKDDALVSFLFASTGVFRAGDESLGEPVSVLLDLDDERDVRVVDELAEGSHLALDLYDLQGTLCGTRLIEQPIKFHVKYLKRVAEEYRRGLEKIDHGTACVELVEEDYDRYGWFNSEFREFAIDRLLDLETASSTRWALAITTRFSKPERELYLIERLGYPLDRWHRQRKAVLVRALGLGLAFHERLVDVAVKTKVVESAKSLVETLIKNFGEQQAAGISLDEDVVEDNWSSLGELAKEHGVPFSKQESSADSKVASGVVQSRRRDPTFLPDFNPRKSSREKLLAMLESPSGCKIAALELLARQEEGVLSAVFAALEKMNRYDAVQVIANAVSLKGAVLEEFLGGLNHAKTYIRHGSALALGTIGGPQVVPAMLKALLREPTNLWKEISRAIGQMGATAMGGLKLAISENSDEEGQERLSWVAAHIAVKEGRTILNHLAASSQASEALVGSRALELLEKVLVEHKRVVDGAVDGHTVNRMYSRRFFEALRGQEGTDGTGAGKEGSAPFMLLDEADMLESSDL